MFCVYLRPYLADLISHPVKPLPSSDTSKKQQVEEMFDAISHKYDFLNHFLSLGIDKLWRRRLRKIMQAKGHTYVLDVATGTGDVAVELCKVPGMKVMGIDISAGMLEKAREKMLKLGLEKRVELMQADSENLPFPDNNFQGISVSFGVRNFQDLKQGLREIYRVLKPGGHVLILEFSKPHNIIFGGLYWFYFKTILPVMGRLLSKSSTAYTYLPASVAAFPEGRAFTEILAECGFAHAEYKALTFGVSTLYLCEKPAA